MVDNRHYRRQSCHIPRLLFYNQREIDEKCWCCLCLCCINKYGFLKTRSIDKRRRIWNLGILFRIEIILLIDGFSVLCWCLDGKFKFVSKNWRYLEWIMRRNFDYWNALAVIESYSAFWISLKFWNVSHDLFKSDCRQTPLAYYRLSLCI